MLVSRGQVMSASSGVASASDAGAKLATRPLPPPPVPPRPSKALVAEALARTRLDNVHSVDKNAKVNAVPTRKAPPPPVASVTKEISRESNKSQIVNTTPFPKERTEQTQKILNATTISKQNAVVSYNRNDHHRDDETNGNYYRCSESAALHLGKQVTQSSREDEGHRKGDFESRVSLDESRRGESEEFRNVHHKVLLANEQRQNSSPEGCSGQFPEPGNPVLISDNNAILEEIRSESLFNDLASQKRNENDFSDTHEKTEIPAVMRRFKSEERLAIEKPKEQGESSTVSHVITRPQKQETVSFPQRDEEKVTEKNESNDHRQQTVTIQEVQNYQNHHYSCTQNTIVLSGDDDEYARTTYTSTPEREENLRANKPPTIMKQNRTIDDKHKKIRKHAPHLLPTGQHKHDNTYTSTSGSRNTVLLIDNNPNKRENFSLSAQQQSDNKDLIINGITASSCSPLVENLIVELRESSQQRTQYQQHNDSKKKEAATSSENGVNSSGVNKENEFDSYKKTPQSRIQHSDWFEVDNGKPVRYSSCHITLEDSHTSSDSSNTESSSSIVDISRSSSFQYADYTELNVDVNFDYRAQVITQRRPSSFKKRRNMASLQGLPPLPKSLSGINLFEGSGGNLHFSPMDQQQQKQEISTPRGMTKSGSFRQLASQTSASGGNNSGAAVRAGPSSSSGRGPTPPTSGGTPHQQMLHHQHIRSLQQNGEGPPPPITPRVRKPTGLDAQLAILRKEMIQRFTEAINFVNRLLKPVDRKCSNSAVICKK
ncbi:probable replication factor C subunit 1 isoform X2 [Periplaneta americana]|uniref:probable replication factor C subunit 1 isoform X2 n=1 Tax=Periplaneta americana TaxID=6978 RepID=UPI0037E8819A